jgi:hypothetical protein
MINHIIKKNGDFITSKKGGQAGEIPAVIELYRPIE